MIRNVFVASIALAVSLSAQVGAPPQPAAGQPNQGTASATAGKPQSDANTLNPNPRANSAPPVPQAGTAGVFPSDDEEDTNMEEGIVVASPVAPRLGPLPEKNVEDPSDTTDLMPISALPKGTATLIGGIVKSVDPINDRITIQPFGSKHKWRVFFDERSTISRNGKPSVPMAIRVGDRIYLDTQLDKAKGKVFARNVRLQTRPLQADAHGQITQFNANTGVVMVHDDLSGEEVRFHLLPAAIIDNMGHPGTVADLQPGALVTARFLAGQNNTMTNNVNQITILAAPGAGYTFEGRVTHLDVREHLLAVENGTDGKIYDVTYDPQKTPIGDLKVGSNVNVSAKFDGKNYQAETISPAEGFSLEEQEKAAQAEEKGTQDDSDQSDKPSKKHKKSKKDKKDEADDLGSDRPRS